MLYVVCLQQHAAIADHPPDAPPTQSILRRSIAALVRHKAGALQPCQYHVDRDGTYQQR